MKKFIVIYYANKEAQAEMEKSGNQSEEDIKKAMEPWMEWAKACGDNLVDLGTPLGGGKKITSSGSEASEKGAVGYSILQANSMDDAEKMLQNHPHTSWNAGCSIEVYEAMPLPELN
ncbi:hypothetical protein CL654_01375 [bacterium]|nr:hypothetical protein [bacterium]